MNTNETSSPESVEQLARRVFTDLHQTIISQETGSLDGSVESIHDMRVAVRRLRVALSNFAVCLPKEDRKRLRLRLENLADALGAVRDMDVIIATMKSKLNTRSDQEKAPVSALITRLRAKRRSRLRVLINYLRNEEYAAFKREFSLEPIKSEPHSATQEGQSDSHFNGQPDDHLDEQTEAPEVIEVRHGQAA